MSANQRNRAASTKGQKSSSARQARPAKKPRPLLKAPPRGSKLANKGQPGGGQGRVDVTGIMPEDIHVDPQITEGHPGYDESGDSEIIPPERLARGKANRTKAKRTTI